MPERLVGIGPFPAYLDQVEALVGLPLYADQITEDLIRNEPLKVEREGLRLRHELYTLVQLAVAGTVDAALLTEDRLATAWQAVSGQEEDFRRTHHQLISRFRGELMEAEPERKTPAIRRLEAALSGLPPKPDIEYSSKRNTIAPEDIGQLPAYMTTLRTVGRIVDIERTNVLSALERRNIPSPRIRLPARKQNEHILSWQAVRQLGEQFGFLPGVAIDFSRLPTGPDDTDEEREAYARQIQRRIVPLYKLTNIPGVVTPEEIWAMRMYVRPYELSLSRLEKLLGGGYHFLEEFISKQGLQLACRLHPENNTVTEYMSKEDAAAAWDEYLSVPLATDAAVPLPKIAQRARVARRFISYSLTPSEREALVSLRALDPRGRVMKHLPKELADDLTERVRRKPLSSYRVPLTSLSHYLPAGYHALRKQLVEMDVYMPRLFLWGANRSQTCCDWPTIRCLEMIFGHMPGSEIDYDRLPRDADDADQARIAYARQIQTSLGLRQAFTDENDNIPPLVDEAYPSFGELDPETLSEVGVLAQRTGFTRKAVVRLLVERGHVLQPDMSGDYTSVLMRLRPPPDASSLGTVARELDLEPPDALDFLRRYRGQYIFRFNEHGDPDIFLDRLSTEMLQRRRFPAGINFPERDVPTAKNLWVHVGQILPLVDATLNDFYRWLSHEGRTTGRQWMHAGRATGPVLLHYPRRDVDPFIRDHQRRNRGGAAL